MRQPYRVESITLKDIGVFEHTHIKFPKIKSEKEDERKAEIHIFTGPNGCGKSTLLYALSGIFRPEPGGDELVRKRYRSKDSSVLFRFSGEEGAFGVKRHAEFQQLWGNDGFSYCIENSWESLIGVNLFHYDNSDRLNTKQFMFAAFAYSGSRQEKTEYTLGAIEQIQRSPFDNALSFMRTVEPSILVQWIANNKTQYALAKEDEEFDEAKKYEKALNSISEFIFDVCGLNLTFKLKRSPLDVVISFNEKNISFETLPEGLKSIIIWVGDLALRLEGIPWENEADIFAQPILLFLDEVDIHLHPRWQRRILPALQKLLPNAQVFVSTHSPFVVGSVEDAYVYQLPEPLHDACRDPLTADTITAVDSKAGKSYQYILSEIFGIDEEFDVETEAQLIQFKDLIRDHLVTKQHEKAITKLAIVLSEKGDELADIVSLELRQMQRIQGKKQG